MKWWDLLKTHPHFSTTPVGLVVIQFNYEAFSSVQEPWIKSKATKNSVNLSEEKSLISFPKHGL